MVSRACDMLSTIPGMVVMYANMSRPLTATFCNCVMEMVPAFSALARLICETSPVTWTLSVMAPTSRVRLPRVAYGARVDGNVFDGQCLEALGLGCEGIGAGLDDVEYARSLRIGFDRQDRGGALVGQGALGTRNRGARAIQDGGTERTGHVLRERDAGRAGEYYEQ